MKTSLFPLLLSVVVLFAGCCPTDYIAEVNDLIIASQEEFNAVADDSSLDEEQIEDRLEKIYKKLQDDVETVASSALARHVDDSVAVFMVDILAQLEICDDDDLLEIIDRLGPGLQNDETICRYREKLSKPDPGREGFMFMDFTARDVKGRKVKFSDYVGKGNYCLVDFWASWCGPCRGEIPNLKKVYDEYADKGLVMLSVAVWDKAADSKRTAEELGICWNQMVDAGNVPTDLYGIDGIPHIILFAPDGTIVKRDLRGKKIMKAVSKVL